ncbi:MAG: hypothetical protein AB7Q16_18535 [Vicinamibacterales bacterium]
MTAALRMLSPFVIACLAATCPVAARAQSIRPLDRLADAAYQLGQRRSGQFRQLVAELDASDVIVHVVTTHEMPAGIKGTTRFVALIEDVRYVRVHLASSLTPKLRAAMLAHELQHACELARSGAASHEAVRALYLAIGMPGRDLQDVFETSEAEQAGRTTWFELGRGLHADADDAPR